MEPINYSSASSTTAVSSSPAAAGITVKKDPSPPAVTANITDCCSTYLSKSASIIVNGPSVDNTANKNKMQKNKNKKKSYEQQDDADAHESHHENRSAYCIFTIDEVMVNRPKKQQQQRRRDEPAVVRTDFETAIKLCGYGKFNNRLVLVCGMMFLCVGCQNGINAYILPSAECDLALTSEQKGLLNAAFLLGGIASSLIWGIVADAYGRKNILVATFLLDGMLTLVSTFSQTFRVLFIFRAISGFTIGAPGSLVYTYLGEFHGSKQRVKTICYVGFFWTLSWLILPGLAWLIIPLPIKWQIGHLSLTYNSWRLYLGIIGLPSILVAGLLARYPESPKFLLSRGRADEALSILRDIYATNNNGGASASSAAARPIGDPPHHISADHPYPVESLSPLEKDDEEEEQDEVMKNKEMEHQDDRSIRSRMRIDATDGTTIIRAEDCADETIINRSISGARLPLSELLSNVCQEIKKKKKKNKCVGSGPLLKWALLCWSIYFTNMFGYYGIGLWLPELLNRFEKFDRIYGTELSMSVCELLSPSMNNKLSLSSSLPKNNETIRNNDNKCMTAAGAGADHAMMMEERVLTNALTINGVCLLGNIASGYLADRAGRRIIPVTTSLVAGAAAFGINFVRSSSEMVIVACLYSLSITTANFVIGSVVVDIFPTRVGALAICMMTFFGRIGAMLSNLAFGMLLDVSCQIPIILVAATVTFGGVLGLFLPPRGQQ